MNKRFFTRAWLYSNRFRLLLIQSQDKEVYAFRDQM